MNRLQSSPPREPVIMSTLPSVPAVFTKSYNPMTVLPPRHIRLCWQTTLYYQQQQYLLACFYEDATRLYHINLLPPADVHPSLIEGFWIETVDEETTLDDLLSYFFGEAYQAEICQDPGAYPRLPYEYVRHLIAISEISKNAEFYIMVK